jgi:hypothetical protein
MVSALARQSADIDRLVTSIIVRIMGETRIMAVLPNDFYQITIMPILYQ